MATKFGIKLTIN